MDNNNNRPDGVEFIIETDEGAITRFIKFTEMDNNTLTDYVMKYPYAMTEWMNRLEVIEKEREQRFAERLKEKNKKTE